MKTPDADSVVAELKKMGSKRVRDGMARYAIPSDKAFGIAMSAMQKLAKKLKSPDTKRNHELASALWETGWYEARTVAIYLDDPKHVTSAQMDDWCADFDSWAICDTACFVLFDRTSHAFGKVKKWSTRRDEIQKRAAFALLACLAAHDKAASDEAFIRYLPLIENGATDERNFVKKGVSWALRLIGRRNLKLNTAATTLSQRLAASQYAAARWIGKGALRELTNPTIVRKLRARESR